MKVNIKKMSAGIKDMDYFPISKVETEVIFNDDNELGKLK